MPKEWYKIFQTSKTAQFLEKKLHPAIQEHKSGLASTANTDVDAKTLTINLDISQPPLKCALSYAYELKNVANAKLYQTLNDDAKDGHISKDSYVNKILHLEAEAAYFRSQVFREFKAPDKDFTSKKEYLLLYDKTQNLPKSEAIEHFVKFMEKNGIVRRYFTASQYYKDYYDTLRGAPWPALYDEIPVLLSKEYYFSSFFPGTEEKKSVPITIEIVGQLSSSPSNKIIFKINDPTNAKHLLSLAKVLGGDQIKLFSNKFQISLAWIYELNKVNDIGFRELCKLLEKNDKEFREEVTLLKTPTKTK